MDPTKTPRIELLKALKPLREFTSEDAREQLRHIDEDTWLYAPEANGKGGKRYICSVLGTLHQELSARPDLQSLVLEAVWMARRMNDTNQNQETMWR